MSTQVLEITDEELLKLSAKNDNLRFERVNGELIAMSPVGEFSGNLESKYITEVGIWAKGKNAKVYSSQAGFRLKNGDVRSPDVAVIFEGHPAFDKKIDGFAPGAPDFLIEIVSKSDAPINFESKMLQWIENDCKLAFLINPYKKKVFIYRADKSITEVPYDSNLTGEQVLPGFEINPQKIEDE
jgi:Uma2 family endonuclease